MAKAILGIRDEGFFNQDDNSEIDQLDNQDYQLVMYCTYSTKASIHSIVASNLIVSTVWWSPSTNNGVSILYYDGM